MVLFAEYPDILLSERGSFFTIQLGTSSFLRLFFYGRNPFWGWPICSIGRLSLFLFSLAQIGYCCSGDLYRLRIDLFPIEAFFPDLSPGL